MTWVEDERSMQTTTKVLRQSLHRRCSISPPIDAPSPITIQGAVENPRFTRSGVLRPKSERPCVIRPVDRLGKQHALPLLSQMRVDHSYALYENLPTRHHHQVALFFANRWRSPSQPELPSKHMKLPSLRRQHPVLPKCPIYPARRYLCLPRRGNPETKDRKDRRNQPGHGAPAHIQIGLEHFGYKVT